MNLEIEKHLVISTGHVTFEDMEVLAKDNQYPLVAKETDYGITIQVDSNFRLAWRQGILPN